MRLRHTKIILLCPKILEIPKWVHIDPNTVHWIEPLLLNNEVNLHFVAKEQYYADAVPPYGDEPLARLINDYGVNINHWYGPV